MNDNKETSKAAFYSLLLTVIPWLIHITDTLFSFDLKGFGLNPLNWIGLRGIFTLPFLHDSWDHLMSNTFALFLLMFGLFLFYKRDAWKILIYLCLISGLLTWFMGRSNSIHIGASGLVYALAAFHFVSGLIKKVPQQLAFSLLVAFLYGGFIWAFFPTLYQHTSISWEGHLSGLLTGIALALYFRKIGPKPPVYSFMEEDDEEEDIEDTYWKIPEQHNESHEK